MMLSNIYVPLFRAKSHETEFGFTMEFFAEIVKEDSAWNTKGRNVIINLAKKDTDAEYWTRLTKAKVKNARIQVDWSKWVDEDEEGGEADKGMGEDWDPSAMQGFGGGGMPGMGGMGGMPGMGGMGGMPGMGGMGGMPGMEGMMGGMGGMPGMGGMGGPGGMGGMNMEEMMKNLGGGGAGMPDSDDEDEDEVDGDPKKADDGLGDLDGDAEKADGAAGDGEDKKE